MENSKGNGSLTHATSEGRRILCDDDLRVTDQVALPNEGGIPLHLTSVINGEIIPRLFLLNKSVEDNEELAKELPRLDVYVAEYAKIILQDDSNGAFTFVERLHADGHQLDEIMIDLLAPTARQLGVWWEEDKIDFVDVTIGTSRLKQILHHYRPSRAGLVRQPTNAPRILLLPTPEETHTFGLLVIAEVFRNNGWEVGGGHALGADEVAQLLAEEHWDIVGFSLANERLMDKLSNAITDVRRRSKNKLVKIMLGGRVFSDDPSSGEQLGADFVVSDPAEAVRLGEALLSDQRSHPLSAD
jgi:methanogenic corrinoid protein MtbC1